MTVILMLQKISISNKCSSFELSIHKGIKKKSNGFHLHIKHQITIINILIDFYLIVIIVLITTVLLY